MKSTISLFPDQEDVRTKLRIALRSSGAVLVFAPTGFGKTVLSGALIQSIFLNGKRVIFCVHRIDLIIQTAETFKKFGIPFSYIANGYHYNPYHRVYIASITSLKNRMKHIKADYIMVDEAHLSMADGWAAVAKHYKAQGAKLIGLTGSPERLDGRPLGDVWDTMVLGPSLRWLIENGRLQKYRAFSPAGLDTAALKIKQGQFVDDEVDALMSGKAVVARATQWWQQLAPGLRTIGFTPSVALAERYAYEFRAAGISALALDGETPQEDRRAAFNAFADREVKVIFNCALFCEGFDLAAQVNRPVVVECVMDNAPTMSLAKHLQKHGRGLRKDDGPAHILLDMVGGFRRLGMPDDDREWSLEGKVKNKQEVENMTCTECFATFAPARICPECKALLFEAKKKKEGPAIGRMLSEADIQLEEIDVDAERAEFQERLDAARTISDFLDLAMHSRMKQPEKWAAHMFTHREAERRKEYG